MASLQPVGAEFRKAHGTTPRVFGNADQCEQASINE